MLVYVLNKHGEPLMPCKPRKARILLKEEKAKIIKYTPFTIQLLYGSSGYRQRATLGVDPGYKNIGLSAVSDKKELFSAEAQARTDMPKLLEQRKMFRRSRRGRKTRYRKARFNNRVRTMHKGWLAPSVENRIQFHVKLVNVVRSILPISRINIEVAQFDIQKLKNPAIEGKEYQQGEQMGFWNVREYVLYRDKHKCQRCKGKSKDPVLNVHHLESRQTGGNRPDNLITLCKTCHKEYHEGEFKLPKLKKGFNAPESLNIMRKTLHERIKALGIPLGITYGYQTKYRRISNGLEKTHGVDAFVIAGGARQRRLDSSYQFRQVRKQNRKLFRGSRSHVNNQVARVLFGFRLWDKVLYKGNKYFIKARRMRGFFQLSNILGTTLCDAKYSKLNLVERSTTLLGMRQRLTFPVMQ